MVNDKTQVSDAPRVVAVAKSHELREAAVAHAREVFEALGLPEAPVSPDAPPPYPPRAVAAKAAEAVVPTPEAVVQGQGEAI